MHYCNLQLELLCDGDLSVHLIFASAAAGAALVIRTPNDPGSIRNSNQQSAIQLEFTSDESALIVHALSDEIIYTILVLDTGISRSLRKFRLAEFKSTIYNTYGAIQIDNDSRALSCENN